MRRLLLVKPDGHLKTVAFLKWSRGKGTRHMLASGITVETVTDEEFEEAKEFGEVEVVAEKP